MKFTDFLQQYGVPYKTAGEHEHAREGWVQFDCVWCSRNGGRYRMGYNVAYRYLNCWSCGPQRLYDTLAELTGAPKAEVARAVGELDVSHARREERCRGTLRPPAGVGPMMQQHERYLRGRRFDPGEVARLWGVKGIGAGGGRLKWRLYIPIVWRGETVSWTTRSLSDRHERRYVSAGAGEEAVPHKRLLYGIDYVRHTAVVVEGPADVWRVGPGAVCTLGTSYTQAQVLALSRLPRVAVAFDPEPAAQRQAHRLAHTLACGGPEVYVVDLGATDPGDAPDDVITRLRGRFLDD